MINSFFSSIMYEEEKYLNEDEEGGDNIEDEVRGGLIEHGNRWRGKLQRG